MNQEDLTTIMAPITDDEIFIIEDFVGSGDVIIDDIVTTEKSKNTTASQQTTFETMVNSTVVDTTEEPKNTTASQQTSFETMVNSTRITTVDTTAAMTSYVSEAASTIPLMSSNATTTTTDIIWPLIGCTASGWIGVALFACYLCKRRRQYTPANAEDSTHSANAEYSSARLSPGETLV